MTERIRIVLAKEFPGTFGLLLKRDSTWLSKSGPEKWEVINLVRKDLYLKPVPMEASIINTLTEMENQILYLKILRRSTTSSRQKHG